MAVTLQVTDGTTTVNLANSTGPELLDRYLPVFAVPVGDGTIPPDVTESLPVIVRISSDDNVASTMQDIAALARRAAEYTASESQATPVWFHRKLENETGAIRFLVRSLSFTPNDRFGSFFDDGPHITDGRLGTLNITHHPYGERTSALAAAGTDDVNVLGGAADYTSTDVVGDVPARLYFFSGDDLAAARVYRQWWIGFRSANRVDTPANLVTLWECEDGTPNGGADTSETTDATASPGGAGDTKSRCTFGGTTSWAWRVAIGMDDAAGGNYDDQQGAFVVLLRAMVDQGTAQVKLQQIGQDATTYKFGPVVDVSATSWTLYNLGTVKFPMRDLHAVPEAMYAATYDQTDSLRVWARVKPGATAPTQFDMDCLVLIPCDEYFIHVQSAEISGTDEELRVCVSPEDVPFAVNVDQTSSYFNLACQVSAIGPGVPTGDGRVFVCCANDNDGTAPAFDDDVDVAVSVIPRWIYFRGAE